jgi:putative transposase
MIEPHWKKLIHYNDPGHAHCLTFSCDQRQHYLVDDRIRLLAVGRLAEVRIALEYDLWAYVIMTNHVHLLVRPRRPDCSIASFLHALKGPVGFHALRVLANSSIRRCWQAGGGFDENVHGQERAVELARYIHNNPVRKGLVTEPGDWRWSSARFWAGQKEFDLAMDEIR